MLRKIRLTLASLCFGLITLLFLDFTGVAHAWFGWLAKLQFLPAVMALNAGVMVLLVALTLVLGRVYCSVICPMGVFQDLIARIGKRLPKRRKLPYTYSPAHNKWRYGVFILFIAVQIAGWGAWAALIAPYSAYGRIANNLFQPLWQWGNNLLASLAERMDSYAFYTTDVWLKSLPTLLIAVATLVAIGILAWRNGRTYCNAICPVGTVLGFLARFSLFRIAIDPQKCTSCSLCARNCKASCIDYKHHQVDHSRCVTCMNCLTKCKHGAIAYRFRPAVETAARASEPSTGETRRGFLSVVGLFASASIAKAQEKKVDGGLAVIEDKQSPERHTPLTPPGSQGMQHFTKHCTACQLCVSACPNEVLHPTHSLSRFMQPEMSYERGYCRPECTKCAEVCPTEAIHLKDLADKSSVQIGHAVWLKKNCIPLADKESCGNCARHCPTGAIQMIPSVPDEDDSLRIPAVNVERCIGCGACENLCPARPFSAIYVEGHARHRVV